MNHFRGKLPAGLAPRRSCAATTVFRLLGSPGLLCFPGGANMFSQRLCSFSFAGTASLLSLQLAWPSPSSSPPRLGPFISAPGHTRASRLCGPGRACLEYRWGWSSPCEHPLHSLYTLMSRRDLWVFRGDRHTRLCALLTPSHARMPAMPTFTSQILLVPIAEFLCGLTSVAVPPWFGGSIFGKKIFSRIGEFQMVFNPRPIHPANLIFAAIFIIHPTWSCLGCLENTAIAAVRDQHRSRFSGDDSLAVAIQSVNCGSVRLLTHAFLGCCSPPPPLRRLQKNIRRGRAEAAVRCALELALKSWSDAIRRQVFQAPQRERERERERTTFYDIELLVTHPAARFHALERAPGGAGRKRKLRLLRAFPVRVKPASLPAELGNSDPTDASYRAPPLPLISF